MGSNGEDALTDQLLTGMTCHLWVFYIIQAGSTFEHWPVKKMHGHRSREKAFFNKLHWCRHKQWAWHCTMLWTLNKKSKGHPSDAMWLFTLQSFRSSKCIEFWLVRGKYQRRQEGSKGPVVWPLILTFGQGTNFDELVRTPILTNWSGHQYRLIHAMSGRLPRPSSPPPPSLCPCCRFYIIKTHPSSLPDLLFSCRMKAKTIQVIWFKSKNNPIM